MWNVNFETHHVFPLHFAQAVVGLEGQSSLGWGGRPLQQQQSPYNQPQNLQSRGSRGRSDEFGGGSRTPPPLAAHRYANNSRNGAGGGRNNNNHNNTNNNTNNNHDNNQHRGGGSNNNNNSNHRGGPQQQQHRNNNHHSKNNSNGVQTNNQINNSGMGKGGGAANNLGYRKLWQQVTCVNRGGRLSESDGSSFIETTVEDLLDVVRHLPAEASAVQAVAQGLCSLDSGALAALLKELNKAGHARRAQEIFDWLRALEPSHNLSALCTTMTYTTMISQCGTQQALRRALELMAEMRGRGVQYNVHTYSALMNVCIKASELDLALDVYRQMTAEACSPNLVTYNTLIDVYGKTGAWEEAVGVLDLLEAQGIEPEVRTYNTVIIACNQSSRATEALRVYERMLAAGAQPTATTYTALISAYGKAGQLDSALQIFQDMLRRGCERNVITYSSLISACEKAGKWELALQLFQEMHAEGCRPNVVTYNSLIAACAQGAQWQKAQEMFDQMQSKGCRPDSVTFGGLIAAYDRAGLWRRALGAFDQMRNLNCRPDTVVYNTIIGALWRTGLLWAQTRATQIFDSACKQGHFRLTVHTLAPGAVSAGTPTSSSASAAALHRMNSALSADFFCSGDLESSSAATGASLSISSMAMDSFGGSLTPPLSPNEYNTSLSAATCRSPSPGFPLASPQSTPLSPAGSMTLLPGVTVEFGMHAFTVGSAVLSLLRWISELRDRLPRDTARMEGNQTVALVLNKGKPSREHTYPAIRAALVAMLTSWSSPFILTDVSQGCRIDATAHEVAEWLNTAPAEAALISFLAQSGTGSGGGGSRGASPIVSCNARDIFFQEDAVIEARCAEAFAAVSRFEAAYSSAAAFSMEQQQHYNATTATANGGGSGCVIIINREETPDKKEAYDNDGDQGDAVFALATHRCRWFRATTDLASICGYSDEVVHDATLLLDRAVAASGKRAMGVSPLAAIVASLHIAARQGTFLLIIDSLKTSFFLHLFLLLLSYSN